MPKTICIYFDGVSSVPQEIELIFDQNIGVLLFDTATVKANKWDINDIVFEKIGDTLNIQFGNSPVQLIKINDVDFSSALNTYLKENGHISWYQKLINLGIKLHIAIALLILGFIVVSYLFIIPWVAEKAVILIPQEYDNEIATIFFNEYVKYSDIDSSKTKALNLFAKQLNLKNTKELRFTVVKSSVVNAFALPDGNIIVYTGLIDLVQEYDELVGLIGHEVAHVNNRHSMKMMCRNLSGYIFISAVLSDVNGIMAVIGDNMHNLQSLSYSRQFERQADYDGFDLMMLNKVNPKGMSNLFVHLQSKQDFSIPAFLSSHPVTNERIDYIQELIQNKSYQADDNPVLNELFKEVKNI